MPLLLLLEENLADLRKLADVGRRAGFNELEIYGYASDAKAYLEKALTGKAPLPNAVFIDLDLNTENGFELVRYVQSNSRMRTIPLIVWAVAGSQSRKVAAALGAYRTVFKDDDIFVLRDALASAIEANAEAGEQTA